MSIIFIDRHDPQLLPGNYKISVVQTVKAAGESDSIKADLSFRVAGPKYRLMPADIATVFPPADSTGDHSLDLPHVTLTRSTIPWELSAGASPSDSTALPWLAILLLSESEMKRVLFPVSVTQNDIDATDKSQASVQVMEVDLGTVGELDADADFLANRLPIGDDLRRLCHVRRSESGEETAVVLGIRLPVLDQMNHAFLISVEHCYPKGAFEPQSFKDENTKLVVRLVVLKAWRFSVGDSAHSISGKLKNLDAGLIGDDQRDAIPKQGVTDAPLGVTLLPYRMRRGSVTAAYYHGPLIATTTVPPVEPVGASPDLLRTLRSPDHLIRYREGLGVFDVTYAAAWELGRLLALSSGSFAKSLIRWKHEHKTTLLASKEATDYFDFSADRDVKNQVPPDVSKFLKKLKTLELIPVNYLLPEPEWVPQESIRFFQVDAYWMQCLFEGAFSIGRFLPGDAQYDAELRTSIDPADFPKSGFLLRSDVVSSCPGLVAQAGGTPPKPPTTTRLLAPGLKLCAFADVVTSVVLHPAAEELHCQITDSANGVTEIVTARIPSVKKANLNGTAAGTFAAAHTVAFTEVSFSLTSS